MSMINEELKIYTTVTIEDYGSAGQHLRLCTWHGNNHISQGFQVTEQMECLKDFILESLSTANEWEQKRLLAKKMQNE